MSWSTSLCGSMISVTVCFIDSANTCRQCIVCVFNNGEIISRQYNHINMVEQEACQGEIMWTSIVVTGE